MWTEGEFNLKTAIRFEQEGNFGSRDIVFLERERHANVRVGSVGYPMRAIRSRGLQHQHLLRHDGLASETNFFFKIDGSQLTFIKNDKGEVTAVIHRASRGGTPDTLGRKLTGPIQQR